jgi:ornithine cyclodeaminase/alanine dehydrogenase-like protein (mu-crystallin family)
MTTETDTLPLIRTKLQRPRLPGDLIPRRRLLDRLHPGLHITVMGSDSEHKQSYSDVLLRADTLVCDRRPQCFRLGELRHGLEKGVLSPVDDIAELGELTSGGKHGRRSDNEITRCHLTGVGVQGTAIALLAYRKARERGFGPEIGS